MDPMTPLGLANAALVTTNEPAITLDRDRRRLRRRR